VAGSVKSLVGGPVKPSPLKPGDLLAVVAPAGPVHEEAFAGGVRVLESHGFRVVLGRHVRSSHGYLAGPDEARAEDLNWAMRDPDVRGIIAARGGYGSGRLLDLLDYGALRNDPKVFVGHSDVTALHLALARETGLVTFHGPMVENLGYRLTRFTLDCFLQAVTSSEPLDVLPVPADYPSPKVVAAGRATGVLTGGNLSLISSLLGTRYEPETKGKVLVLEETGERTYQVDRLLCHLRLAGKLAPVAAAVVGEMVEGEGFPGEPEAPGAAAPLSLDDVVAGYFGGLGRPVISGLPCGHGRDKLTLPLGVVATVDGYKARLIIEEAACV
jgi:muramoyltetrapeptide carboxypeptidase